MFNRAMEYIVGIFILMGIISLMILSIKVSGLSTDYKKGQGYTIIADFNNIGGLKTRAKVTIGGVQVGRVTNIGLSQEASDEGTVYLSRVTMIINKNVSTIPEDSKALILTSGLLGDNYIGLEPGFSKDILKNNSHIPLENTNSALVLEDLISKFLSTKVSSP